MGIEGGRLLPDGVSPCWVGVPASKTPTEHLFYRHWRVQPAIYVTVFPAPKSAQLTHLDGAHGHTWRAKAIHPSYWYSEVPVVGSKPRPAPTHLLVAEPHFLQPLADGAGALIGSEQALAGRSEVLGDARELRGGGGRGRHGRAECRYVER